MKLLGPIIVVTWWIALFGISDTLMSGWSKSRRLAVYTGFLLLSLYAIYNYPHLVERL